MLLRCLFLVITTWGVPVDLEEYEVMVIPPLPSIVRKRGMDVFLVPRALTVPKRFNSLRLDVRDYDTPTEVPDVNYFDYTLNRAANPQDSLELSYSFGNEDRIVGGSDTEINVHPYHVGYGINCGGAIIGSKWVLTAGHCGTQGYIRSGTKYRNRGQRTAVVKNHIHPMWAATKKEHPFDYDFQVLELQTPLAFDETTQPIRIARDGDFMVGRKLTVTGWGRTREEGFYSLVLQVVSVPVVHKSDCQKVPFPYFQGGLTDRMFCAGYRGGKKDACQGDSGGPAVSHGRLYGMVSFGYGCATPGSYGVYSKVSKVRNWIKEITGLDMD